MKERPILFSGPMVRAILDGTKTQTRRVCKNKVYGNGFHFDGHELLCHNDFLPPSALLMDYRSGGHELTTSNLEGWGEACPYGQPGDRLWVRETFQPLLSKGVEHGCADWETGKGYAISYPATDGIKEWIDADDNIGSGCKPSIHMPRWASRITLEITGVRVERLHDISESDAQAEGVIKSTWDVPEDTRHRFGFAEIWEAINGAGSWTGANPWVWVMEFKRVGGNEQ